MNIFNSIFLPKQGSNRFDLSHDVKLSFKMGELIPTCVMDVLPGDSFDISVANMLRFAPLLSPVMHTVKVSTHFFFVPNRILWPGWEDWITGESDVEPPYFDNAAGDIDVGHLGDYLGYPTGVTDNALKMSLLPASAYVKIWDDYYRDQNLQTERWEPLNDGQDNFNSAATRLAQAPMKRAWEHDYFTSALPFAQKGDAVQIPLVNQQNIPVTLSDSANNQLLVDPSTKAAETGALAAGTVGPASNALTAGGNAAQLDPNGTLEVDVQAEAADINSLRRAFALQRWLERNARAGTRYIESILANFGVKSDDARLQRPEFIGGATQRMTISEVLSTAQTDDSMGATVNPVGELAGHGISVGSSKRFKYYAKEHGWIIGITCVRPTTAYQQGLPKMLQRQDRFDYFWHDFAHIGEQAVKVSEVWAEGTLAQMDATFGYMPRYAEYRFMNSRVAGDFKDTLNYWHFGRIFSSAPALNSTFITCDPSTRVFAVEDPAVDHIYVHVFNNVSAVRKVPRFGIPSLI